MTDSNRLDGQAAIVPGAAQGIGKGIALVLAEAGAAIVDEIRAGGGRAVSITMDTSKPEDARSLVDLALEETRRLDILVNPSM